MGAEQHGVEVRILAGEAAHDVGELRPTSPVAEFQRITGVCADTQVDQTLSYESAGGIVGWGAYFPALSRRESKDVLSDPVNQESLPSDEGVLKG